MFIPVYIKTYESGELDKKINSAYEMLKECTLCPRSCKANRLNNEKGFCKSGKLPIVSSYAPHFGEERPLVGQYGSGTIFFTNCNLGCIFCQNYDISHLGDGAEIDIETLSAMMISLKRRGCHNINFVTPTHFVPQILASLKIAIENGLNIPLVYNTGGYDSITTLKLLDGIFDIYMPDFKYWDKEIAEKFSNAADYPEMAKDALKEMHRQVGNLILDNNGVAQKGLLVRHLVLPENLAGTYDAMKYIADKISPDTYVNVMAQYYPCFKASDYLLLDRRITHKEFIEAIEMAKRAGIWRFDKY